MIEIKAIIKDNVQRPEREPDPGYIATRCNGDLYTYYYKGDSIPDFPSFTKADEKLLEFRLAFSTDAGYVRIIKATDGLPNVISLTIVPLISVLMQSPIHYPSLKTYWNSLIDSVPLLMKPTTAEINSWKAIVSTNNIPISFNSSGKIS